MDEEKLVMGCILGGCSTDPEVEMKTCFYCKNILDEKSELCPSLALKYKQAYEGIMRDGDLTALTKLMIATRACNQYEYQPDKKIQKDNLSTHTLRTLELLDGYLTEKEKKQKNLEAES